MSAKTGKYIICQVCGKEKYYPGHKFKRKRPPMYCSRKCKYIGAIKQSTGKCLICGIEFQFKPGKKRKYCSLKCAGKAKQQRVELICQQCGKSYTAVLSSLPRKYCSPKCRCIGIRGYTPWNKGKKMPQEAVLKNSIAKRGENHPNWGKHLPLKTRNKISKSNKGKRSGEDSPVWKGGLSFEPYSFKFNKDLKEQIRRRDNYQCQFCGVRQNGKNFPVHHIDYDKKNSQSKNLVTLCPTCHTKTNFKRKNWQFYFTDIKPKNFEEELLWL